jgi:hypothetical protein
MIQFLECSDIFMYIKYVLSSILFVPNKSEIFSQGEDVSFSFVMSFLSN